MLVALAGWVTSVMNRLCRYANQILGWLFSPDYPEPLHGPRMRLPTLHASIDGNAVWSTLSLRIADERVRSH